jgi:hypothetical protein
VGLTWAEQALNQNLCAPLGPLSESHEGESTTPPVVLVTHYGNIDYVTELFEVILDIILYIVVSATEKYLLLYKECRRRRISET